MLGEAYTFSEEKGGETIHNVSPVKGQETSKSNEGSMQDFHLHTEVAHHSQRPHFVVLICIRQDHQRAAVTYVTDISTIFPSLDKEDVVRLRQPEYVIYAPASFGPGIPPARTAILSGSDSPLELRVNFNAMMAASETAKGAMDRLHNRLGRDRVACTLSPGDLLVLNNRRAVHGRNSFVPRYDGYDRWLQRVYVRTIPHPDVGND